jgi:hypothetical protein
VMRPITDHSPHAEEAPSLTLPRAQRLMRAVSKGEGVHSALRRSFETTAAQPPQDEVE